jgi:hypothetical protein
VYGVLLKCRIICSRLGFVLEILSRYTGCRTRLLLYKKDESVGGEMHNSYFLLLLYKKDESVGGEMHNSYFLLLLYK